MNVILLVILLRSLRSSLTHCSSRRNQQRIPELPRLEKPSKIIESNHALTLPSPPATNVPKCHIHVAFWTLQGMVIPPLIDKLHNNNHNIHIWNMIGKKRSKKKNRECYHHDNLQKMDCYPLKWVMPLGEPHQRGKFEVLLSHQHFAVTWDRKELSTICHTLCVSGPLGLTKVTATYSARGKTHLLSWKQVWKEKHFLSSYQQRDIHDFGRSHQENR